MHNLRAVEDMSDIDDSRILLNFHSGSSLFLSLFRVILSNLSTWNIKYFEINTC